MVSNDTQHTVNVKLTNMPINAQHHSKYFLPKHFRLSLLILGLFLLPCEILPAAPNVEAYSGSPFGVGRVTIDVFRGEPGIPLSDERFTIWQEENRTMYPVVKDEPAKELVRELLPVKLGRKVTIYFLFQGTGPFDLSVFSPVEQAVRVKPIDSVTSHRRLLNEWWKQYSGRWRRLSRDKEFPPVAQNFLTVSLARRLDLALPKLKGGLFSADQATGASLLDLFAGESYHQQVDREMLQDQPLDDGVLQPLPAAPVWPGLDMTPVQDVVLEPIADHVPEECFYIRFGKFLNYLWFRDLNQKWQGDLQNMINRRALDRASSKRIEQQLSLKYNAMAKILGPQIVEDLALIGLDPYVVDGAAIGVLIQAKNNFLLNQDLMRQRRGSLTSFKDATESKVKIAGKDVSLIATPGGEVRSYYAQDGNFHLVTTSSTLVKRFIEAGQGERSLGSLPSFQLSRERLPASREDTVFVFVPERFYENLCSPHYRIETARRVKSAREPMLLELAGYASITENQPLVEQEELIAAGYLPNGFGKRVDGSSLKVVDGKVVDSVRGVPGFFLPVADVEPEQVSSTEITHYQRFLSEYKANVGRMPPMAVAISREKIGDELVTISVDVVSEPIGDSKLADLKKWVSNEPSTKRLGDIEGDVVSIEVALSGGLFSNQSNEGQPYHAFAGLRDFRSPLTINDGKLRPDGDKFELIRAYVGSWPRPGILGGLVGPGIAEQPVEVPAGPLLGNTWQAKQNDFLLLSLKRDVINEVMPQLEIVNADRPAQVWLAIDDLTGKQLADTVNTLGYMRTREACVAACRLMNSLANQFRIDRSQCRELAERLIDGRFVCPLGGEYQLLVPERDLEVWVSTALPAENRFLLTQVPEDYHLPLLEWFRGLRGDVTYEGEQLKAHLELDIAADAVPQ